MFKNILFFTCLITINAFAIQEIQVDVEDQNFNSSSRVVIDQEQIKRSRVSNVTELLATQANIQVVNSNFQPNSIYLRGGDSSHVLILIDGVPTYDPSSVQRTLNLNQLNVSSIKKIEILKGSQTVLYGGQAFSGVIHIETFSDQESDGSHVQISGWEHKGYLEAGNYKNWNTALTSAVHAKYTDVYSKSPVKDSKKLYPEKTVATDLTLKMKSEGFLDQVISRLNYSDNKNEISTSDFATFLAVDTEKFNANTESYGISVVGKHRKNISISANHQYTRRIFFQNAIDAGGTASDQDYFGKMTSFRIDGNYPITERFKLIAGVGLVDEKMKYLDSQVLQTDAETQFESRYLKFEVLVLPELQFEVGGRTESTELNPIDTSYQVGVSWADSVRLEYSTGFKLPSLFQLYSSYGNKDLKTEKAKNISLTFENKLNEYFNVSMTMFDTQFENLIIIRGSPQRYENVSATRTQGVEFFTSAHIPDQGYFASFSVGYQEPKDLSLGNWLVRRPLRTASLKVSKKFFDQMNLGFEVNHTGDRRDRVAARYVTVDEYTLLNLIADYGVDENLSVFARLDNVENKDYQTSYGFYNRGLTGKIGLEAKF